MPLPFGRLAVCPVLCYSRAMNDVTDLTTAAQRAEHPDRVALVTMYEQTMTMGKEHQRLFEEARSNMERCAGTVQTLRALIEDYDKRHDISASG